MFCPKCGRQLPDGTKFCGGCGAALNAGAPVEAPVNPVYAAPAAPVYAEPVEAPVKEGAGSRIKNALGGISSKFLMIGAIALAVILVAVLVVSLLSGGDDAHVMYLKDDQISFNDFSKKAPYEVTSKLMDDAGTYTLVSNSAYLSNTMYLTEDGKTLFYLDKMDTYGEGTLYYVSTSFKKEATKIDSGVSRYHVSEDGKLVTYLKGEKLCQYNMKESTTIAKDVNSLLAVSNDGKTIYYREYDNGEYTYYSYSAKNGEEKIGTGLSSLSYTEDYATVYYMDEDKLCSKAVGKDATKLVKHVYSYFGLAEDGSFYYLTAEEDDATMADYFKNDCESYEYLYENLAEWEGYSFYTLNYYNGKSETVIADGLAYEPSVYSIDGGCVVRYSSYDVSELGGLSMQTLYDRVESEKYSNYYDGIYQMVQDQLGDITINVCISGTVSALDIEEFGTMAVSFDGKTAYILSEVNDDGEYVLSKATISKNAIKSIEEVDDDVYSGSFLYNSEGERTNTYAYFKDVKDGEGELFIDGVSVDDDVYTGGYMRYNEHDSKVLYLVDYNNSADKGTLKSWNGKKSEEIMDEIYSFSILDDGDLLLRYEYDDDDYCYSLALYSGKLTEISDEVHSAAALDDGTIVYLYDYSTSKYEGELYRFSGKKSTLIDEDVSAIIYVYDEQYIREY